MHGGVLKKHASEFGRISPDTTSTALKRVLCGMASSSLSLTKKHLLDGGLLMNILVDKCIFRQMLRACLLFIPPLLIQIYEKHTSEK